MQMSQLPHSAMVMMMVVAMRKTTPMTNGDSGNDDNDNGDNGNDDDGYLNDI